jgi:hypothetical protein
LMLLIMLLISKSYDYSNSQTLSIVQNSGKLESTDWSSFSKTDYFLFMSLKSVPKLLWFPIFFTEEMLSNNYIGDSVNDISEILLSAPLYFSFD